MSTRLADVRDKIINGRLYDEAAQMKCWLACRFPSCISATGAVIHPIAAPNGVAQSFHEFAGLAWLTRRTIDSSDFDTRLKTRIDDLMAAAQEWFEVACDRQSDVTLIERVPFEADAQLDFQFDAIVIKVYMRCGFVGADGAPITVDPPRLIVGSDDRAPSWRTDMWAVSIGAPIEPDSTLYENRKDFAA